MLRAFSTRRSYQYEKLGDEPAHVGHTNGCLKRAMSVPARVLGTSRKSTSTESKLPDNKAQVKHNKRASKSHPIFGLFYSSRKKKPTAKPEFARYLEYVKEGGKWDARSNMPAIYYK